jgi:hypothetical protein
MSINNKSLINVVSSKDFTEFHIRDTEKLFKIYHINDTKKIDFINNKIEFHKTNGFRRLVFSKKSNDNLNNYVVPKDIRVEVLNLLPNRKDIIQLDENNCIKYIKTDTMLFVSTYRWTNQQIHTYSFSVDLLSGYIIMDYSDTITGKLISNVEVLVEKYYSKFLVVVTYLELTDVTLNIVEGTLTKKKKTYSGLLNTSRFNVIHVNTNWNVETINLNSFSVKGHYRLQMCGVGRKTPKYVYVTPYTKGLVNRLSQRELVS